MANEVNEVIGFPNNGKIVRFNEIKFDSFVWNQIKLTERIIFELKKEDKKRKKNFANIQVLLKEEEA